MQHPFLLHLASDLCYSNSQFFSLLFRILPSCFQSSTFALRVGITMPIQYGDVLAICAQMTLEEAYPFNEDPTQPLTRKRAFALLETSTATARLWLGNPQHNLPAFFKEPDLDLHDIALLVVERDAHLHARISSQDDYLDPFYPREEVKFCSTWGGRDKLHNTRPFIRASRLH